MNQFYRTADGKVRARDEDNEDVAGKFAHFRRQLGYVPYIVLHKPSQARETDRLIDKLRRFREADRARIDAETRKMFGRQRSVAEEGEDAPKQGAALCPVADAGSPDRSDGGMAAYGTIPLSDPISAHALKRCLHPKGEPVARDCDGVELREGDWVEVVDEIKLENIGKAYKIERIFPDGRLYLEGAGWSSYTRAVRRLTADDGYYANTGKVVRGCFKHIQEGVNELNQAVFDGVPTVRVVMRCV